MKNMQNGILGLAPYKQSSNYPNFVK